MVSIITVNFNGYKDTCELIESLRQNETYPYEIIVVDNASCGDDAQRLKAQYEDLIVVASENNLGFAGANNLGYGQSKGEYILYLNNDTIVRTPLLETLVLRMQSDGVGAVSPKIKYEYAPEIIQYAGYTQMNMITTSNDAIGSRQRDNGLYDTAAPTPFVHGACVMSSRKVIESAGNMTDIFFLFYEELDWSIQLREQGYELWYEPKATVYHKESMTIRRGMPQRNYYMTRSRLLFTRRRTKGVRKVLSVAYLLFISYPINVLRYASHKEWKMISTSTRGSWFGLVSAAK